MYKTFSRERERELDRARGRERESAVCDSSCDMQMRILPLLKNTVRVSPPFFKLDVEARAQNHVTGIGNNHPCLFPL